MPQLQKENTMTTQAKLTDKQELELLRTKNKFDLMVKLNKAGNVYLQAKNGIKFSGNMDKASIQALFSDKQLQSTINYLVSQLN